MNFRGHKILKKLTYIQGAFILAITNFITGALVFGFRIFFSRHIDSEGMGVFQLVLPLQMLLITLVSGGITTAISKVVAEYKTKKNMNAIHKTIKTSLFAISTWSFFLCLVMMLNAEWISQLLLNDKRTILSILFLTPSVFFISIASVFRGYFFGFQEFKKPAVIDIVEKFVRLGALILMMRIMLPHGIKWVCAGAMLAMTAGECISALLLGIQYYINKPIQYSRHLTESGIIIMKKIIKLAIPLSLCGALSTIMDMLSAVMVPDRLVMAGYDASAALSLYGELTGMVMPLIFFPGIIIFSLTITLIPSITQSYVSHYYLALNKKCNDSLTISWAIGLFAAVLCVSFSNELCDVVYKCPQAGHLLFWMGWGCPFHYLHFIQFAILNGLGLQRKVLSNVIWDLLITVACIYLLIPIPAVGIYGYVVGFLLSGIFVTIKNMIILNKQKNIKIKYTQAILKPLLPFIFMFSIVNFTNTLFLSIGFKYNMIFSGVIGIMAFAAALLMGEVFTLKQIKNVLQLR